MAEFTKGKTGNGKWIVVTPEIEPQRLIIDCEWTEEKEKRYHRSICRTFGYCDTKEEELANANLIAAAPDMYEALKEISEYKYLTGTNLGKQIKQAIAKAEGK